MINWKFYDDEYLQVEVDGKVCGGFYVKLNEETQARMQELLDVVFEAGKKQQRKEFREMLGVQ